MHIDEAVKELEIQLRANQRSKHTVTSYLRDVAMLRRWLETEHLPLVVEELTPSMLLRFAASKACTHQADGTPRKPSSVDKIKMSLRAFFGSLYDAALIPTNPARVLRYRRGRQRVPETLTEEETRKLVDAATGSLGWRDAAILDVFLQVGLRVDALVQVDIADVRQAEGRIVVRHQKGGNETVKAIPSALRDGLKQYMARRLEIDSDCPALFLSTWKRRLSTRQVRLMVIKRGKDAGISKHVHPHMLRRTYGTLLYEKTKDLLLVQRALDHVYVGTTQRYTAGAVATGQL